ncbi:hypothetical protein FKP32DRAFT_555207 [Trametes sanguinea]|nr:hypothetical protein FKP32DRAFT_555207 [Trametes sanguinea]
MFPMTYLRGILDREMATPRYGQRSLRWQPAARTLPTTSARSQHTWRSNICYTCMLAISGLYSPPISRRHSTATQHDASLTAIEPLLLSELVSHPLSRRATPRHPGTAARCTHRITARPAVASPNAVWPCDVQARRSSCARLGPRSVRLAVRRQPHEQHELRFSKIGQ